MPRFSFVEVMGEPALAHSIFVDGYTTLPVSSNSHWEIWINGVTHHVLNI